MFNYNNFTVDETNSGEIKTINNSINLKDHLEDLNNIEIDTDTTKGNYSNSIAIKILDDVAKSPIDTNVS